MDLLGYSEEAFEAVKKGYLEFAGDLELGDIQFIPLSALKGDNVVTPGVNMPWYAGSTLMHFLENVALSPDRNLTDLRFPVQFVNRPTPDFRGYSGTIVSGILRAGDEVTVLPSHKTNRVKSIVTFDGEKAEAFAPMAVTLTLEKEIDVGRGDMIVHPNNLPHMGQQFEAMVVWMAEQPLVVGKQYCVKHFTRLVNGIVGEIRHRVNVNTLAREPAAQVALNEIAHVRVELDQAVAFDSYRKNRATGAFIFVDRMTNATVGAGMILDREAVDAPGTSAEGDAMNFGKLLCDLQSIERLLREAIMKLAPSLSEALTLDGLQAGAILSSSHDSLDKLLATHASLVPDARLEAGPLVGLWNALTRGRIAASRRLVVFGPEKGGKVPVEAVLEMTGEWFDRQLQLTGRALDRLRRF
jgi:sulfate adenylyltransferase subunit 1 (EFTu-like GTPase family)